MMLPLTLSHHWDDASQVSASTRTAQIDGAAAYIRSCLPADMEAPLIAVICGSGLSAIADGMKRVTKIPYEKIPGFPQPTVAGHGSAMAVGLLGGIPTVCLLGRFHFYEGHPMASVVFPIHVLAKMGVGKVIITNAAGGICPSLKVGDIMVVEDHINLLGMAGLSPLRGENLSAFGTRFPAMTQPYHGRSFEIVCEAARQVGLLPDSIKRGIYVGVGGPSYETRAELRFLASIGGSCVGMSTVSEVIVANHVGISVIALSLITNVGVSSPGALLEGALPPTHEEVLQAGALMASAVESLVAHVVPAFSADSQG